MIDAVSQFMGMATAMSMHEMQNILAIIRESAGLLGDVMQANSRLDFKHKDALDRALGHIVSQVERGKSVLDATSRLAHAVDADLLKGCDLAVYAQALAQLCERMVRLRGARLEWNPSPVSLPVAAGAIWILMIGFRAIQWALGEGSKDGVVRLWTEKGSDFHVLHVEVQGAPAQDTAGLEALRALMEKGRVEWDGTRLRILFPAAGKDTAP